MTKRAKLITALVAAIGLVVIAPLSAVAYWVVSTQLAVTAQASTFSIAPMAVSPSAAGFTGWAGTKYFSAPLTNDGAAPWGGQTVTVAAASGFGTAAIATVQVAFSASAAPCQSDGVYTGVTPKSALTSSSWTASAPVASGATVHACIKLVVTDTDTHTLTGAGAPAPSLSLTTTATATQHNWRDDAQAQLAVSSTGWAACKTTGNSVDLTLPTPVAPGTYTVVRNDTGASLTGTVTSASRGALSLTYPAGQATESAETYVTVKNAQGDAIAVARLTFQSSSKSKNLECA